MDERSTVKSHLLTYIVVLHVCACHLQGYAYVPMQFGTENGQYQQGPQHDGALFIAREATYPVITSYEAFKPSVSDPDSLPGNYKCSYYACHCAIRWLSKLLWLLQLAEEEVCRLLCRRVCSFGKTSITVPHNKDLQCLPNLIATLSNTATICTCTFANGGRASQCIQCRHFTVYGINVDCNSELDLLVCTHDLTVCQAMVQFVAFGNDPTRMFPLQAMMLDHAFV